MGSDLPLKILFVVPYVPDQIRTRSLNLIKGLAAAGHRITLATLWSNTSEFEFLKQLGGILDGLIAEKMGSVHSGWNCLRALAGPDPMQAHYSWSPLLMQKISEALKMREFDVVHAEHLRGVLYALHVKAAGIASRRKRPAVVWDSVDCISDLFRRASQSGFSRSIRLVARIELPRTERFEGWLATQFGCILVTSETDRQGLLRLAEKCRKKQATCQGVLDKRIAVLPNGVDLTYFSPSDKPREPQTLIISGKMSYHANVAAVLRFAEDVMPEIWARLPETKLWIVGKDPPSEIVNLGVLAETSRAAPRCRNKKVGDARIHVTGTVSDVRPYLRRATVSVAPIRYGTGIQNKVLEAMACGTPVIATPQAVKALHVQAGRHLVVENDERNLADSICSLLTDPKRCSRLGRAGRIFVETNHDWRSIVENLSRIYQNARSCR